MFAKPKVSAKAKVVSYLSRREHSVFELEQKLKKSAYDEAEIAQAIEWAQLHQFQSNERFKLSLFRRRANTYGDKAIASELAQHGLRADLKISLDANNDASIETEQERALQWLQRRYCGQLARLIHGDQFVSASSPELLQLKSKAFKALAARGFESGNIERAWKRLLSELS